MPATTIAAVCHFCEQHGPRVLHCTQSYHASLSLSELVKASVAPERESYYPKQPEGESSTKASTVAGAPLGTCVACAWRCPEPGFVTNDHTNHTTYATTHRPFDDGM
jgi:hypothetical protein